VGGGSACGSRWEGIIGWSLRAPETPSVTHLRMSLEPAERLQSSDRFNRPARTAFDISPDGRYIVFSGKKEGVTSSIYEP
jgi:hypothetical protein